MPRGCGCAGNSCGCLVQAGPGVNVTGTGNATDPYIVATRESINLQLGPYTVAGANVDLDNYVDGNAIVIVDYEVDLSFKFPDTAPVGTRIEVRAMPSFGSDLIVVGNVWFEAGQPDTIPAPASGNLWISAVKMDSLNWFARVTNVVF